MPALFMQQEVTAATQGSKGIIVNKNSVAPLHGWEKLGLPTSLLPLRFHSELTRHKPVNRFCREADVSPSVQVCVRTAVSLLERPLLVSEESEVLEMELTRVPSHPRGYTQNRECERKKGWKREEKTNLLT